MLNCVRSDHDIMILNDEYFLRQAILEAYAAREQGGDPMGAVLVYEGKIVHRQREQSIMQSDPTAHAELMLMSTYCREHQLFSLEGYSLYTSTEPCVMCSGAIHWARISRVVFSVSQTMLQQLSGGKPKPSCESIISVGRRKVEIVGPLIPEEGLKVFDGFAFQSRAERHKQWMNRG